MQNTVDHKTSTAPYFVNSSFKSFRSQKPLIGWIFLLVKASSGNISMTNDSYISRIYEKCHPVLKCKKFKKWIEDIMSLHDAFYHSIFSVFLKHFSGKVFFILLPEKTCKTLLGPWCYWQTQLRPRKTFPMNQRLDCSLRNTFVQTSDCHLIFSAIQS